MGIASWSARAGLGPRRGSAAALVLLCVLAWMAWPRSGAGVVPVVEGAGERPNIVLLCLDDVVRSQLKEPPDLFPRARERLRDLALRPLHFPRTYATTPLCSPSRATLLRSQYAHDTGILHNYEIPPGARNGGAIAFHELGLEADTLATDLEQAGYSTHLIGKYLNGYRHVEPRGYVPPGWTSWFALLEESYFDYTVSVDGVEVSYGSEEEDYLTDVLGNRAADAIREAESDRPLFLFVSLFAPHAPPVPAPRHADQFPELAAPRGPAYAESDTSDKPTWVQELPWGEPETARADSLYAGASRTLLAVDDAIVEIVDALVESGRLDDTVFIFTNDNGFSYGDHRWTGKSCPYESCLRIPLVFLGRPVIDHRALRLQIASTLDIAPTIAELAGIPPGSHAEGESLVRYFAAPDLAGREDLLIERWQRVFDAQIPPDPIPTWAGVITEDGWKYVEHDTNEIELYDIRADRSELENLAGDPEYGEIVERLAERIRELRDP